MRRFEQEARAASALNHPNILTVHDVGSEAGAPFVVAELLKGETLRERLTRGPLSPGKTIDYATQIADGLSAAHEAGIVHRDLKPDNLFLAEGGRVKILDFGLAKLTQPKSATESLSRAPTGTWETEPGVILGTLGYMSPEQVRGEPADNRSDLFALGTILYEMLTGRRAFHAKSAAETMSAILKEDPPELSEAGVVSAPLVSHIVRRCLEKSPARRFQSAPDLSFALKSSAAESDAARFKAAISPRARRWALAGAVVLGVLAAVGALVLAGNRRLRGRHRGSGGPSRIESLAVLPLENLSRDPDQEYFSDGMTDELITDLSRIGALRVISRTSVGAYKRTRKPVADIARELHVDALVEGSVLRSGERVRITAQLIHAPTDRHLWAESYERDLRDVLKLQSEVARAIAKQIEITVTPQEQSSLAASRAIAPEPHDAYLRGRYYLGKDNEDAIRKAIGEFEQSIAKEPRYALAYAGLSDAYSA